MDPRRRSRLTDEGPSDGDTSLESRPEPSRAATGGRISGPAGAAAAGDASAAAQRRERHRDVVKQSYYRKRDTLEALRGDVQQLELQFSALMTRQRQWQQQRTPNDSFFELAASGVDVYGPARPPKVSVQYEALISLYARATAHKEGLLREHKLLRRRVNAHDEFQRKLRVFTEEQIQAMQRAPSFLGENHANGAPPMAPRVTIEPVTSAECLVVAASAYRDIRAFLARNSVLTSGVSSFGWRGSRAISDGKLTFSLKKLHHGVDASKTARRGYEACAQRLRQFYPSSMDMTHYTVQQVDENNTVLYRVMVSPDRQFATKALMLVSHFHTETGGAMIIRSLDPSRVRSHKPEALAASRRVSKSIKEDARRIERMTSEQWVNVFTWILFDRTGSRGEDCTMDFGGIVPRNTVVDSDVWMIELLPIALRLESDIIAPLFTV